MGGVQRGRLDDPDLAPGEGERHEVLALLGAVRVEHVLSGRLAEAEHFVADTDEWVAVLAGGARLEVEGEVLELRAGEWLVIPAGVPHVLHETEPGTSWLTVHAPAGAGPS